jgi:hypothetical protein
MKNEIVIFNIGGKTYTPDDPEYNMIKNLFDKYDEWLFSQGAVSSGDFIRKCMKEIVI